MTTDAARYPHDRVAEAAVLGAIFLDPENALPSVAPKLAAEDFYVEAHRRIYRAMLAVEAQGKAVDVLTVRQRLREDNALKAVGGGAYLSKLADATPTAANVTHHVQLVRGQARLRSLLAFAREIERRVADDATVPFELADWAAAESMQIASSGVEGNVRHVSHSLRLALEQAQRVQETREQGGLSGTPSGYRVLDERTGGWQPGDLVVVAGRPGMGKTAFALDLLTGAAEAGTPALVFSLEMSHQQLATRLWAQQSRVSLTRIRLGNFQRQDWERLYAGSMKLEKLPIWIDDTPTATVGDIMRKARQAKADYGIGLVVVDYLQLMQGSQRRGANREQEIAEISRNLKVLAKQLGCPVIALSQLNRGVESRSDKRPLLSDLRESGAIEQDADCILFLYRDAYYQQMKGGSNDGPRLTAPKVETDVAEVIIAKHRSGPTGKVELAFDGRYTTFADPTDDAEPPPPTEADAPGFIENDVDLDDANFY